MGYLMYRFYAEVQNPASLQVKKLDSVKHENESLQQEAW